MSKGYSYHNSRSRNEDYHYRPRHTPYSPAQDRPHNSRRDSPRNYNYEYEFDDRYSRPNDRGRSHGYRDPSLRSSDPYNNGRSYHTEEYSHLRRTEPSDHYDRERRHASPYSRPPPQTTYNSRYPPPHYPASSNSIPQQRETSAYPRQQHEQVPYSSARPHLTDSREKYQQPIYNNTQPVAQVPVTQTREEEIEPEFIKSYRVCMNQKLQIRGKYLEAFLVSSQTANEHDSIQEEIQALERRQIYERNRRMIFEAKLAELDSNSS